MSTVRAHIASAFDASRTNCPTEFVVAEAGLFQIKNDYWAGGDGYQGAISSGELQLLLRGEEGPHCAVFSLEDFEN